MRLNMATARHWFNLVFGRVEPQGNSQRRYARIIQAGLSAVAGRGIAIIVGFVSVPLAVGYLGAERYGIWITISSILIWLALADVGLGHSLTNALSEAYGKEQPHLAQQYVATAFWALVLIALVMSILGSVIWYRVDWAAIFNVRSTLARAEAAPAVAAALFIFLCGLPFSLIAKVYGAYQEGAYANYWLAAANIASLLALVAATWTEGGLVWLVVAFSGAMLIVQIGSALWLFGRQKPWLRPSLHAFRKEHLRKLLGIGTMFFVVQIAALLSFQSDNIIIAYYLGAEYVTPYNITWRLFTLTTLVQNLVFPALWPAYTEAFSRGDNSWIIRTLRLNVIFSVLLTLVSAAVLVVFGQDIIQIWSRGQAVPPFELLVWMAIWVLIFSLMQPTSCMLNGLGRVKGQMTYGSIAAVVNVLLSIFLVTRYGITGAIAATVASYAIFNLVPQLIETALVVRGLSKESSV